MLAEIRLAKKLALKLEMLLQQWCSILIVNLPVTHTHTQAQKSTVEMKVLAEECSCAPVSLTTSHGEMRQSHHPTPWLIHQFTYTQATCAINWQKRAFVCVCVCAYKPNLHSLIAEHIVTSLVNANWTCKGANILYRETTKHSHRYTHPASSLHSQSQIRWQIRRLILLGGRGIGVPPLLQVVPQDTYTPLTHTSLRGLQLHAQTPHIAVRKPLHPYKCRHFLSLSLSPSSLAPSLSLPLSPSLPLSISPPSLSSLTANQTGGDIIVLQPVRRQDYECVWWERKGESETHTRTL